MQAINESLEEIDRAYEHLEQSLRTEMASLQLQIIKESSDRKSLVSTLEHIIESINTAELEGLSDPVGQLLPDYNGATNFSHPSKVIVHHPELAEVTRRLAAHQQPASLRFRILQGQMYHASQQRVIVRQEISKTLKRWGLVSMSKEMKRQAALIEMGSYRRQ
jgi:hypothetical protein